MKLQKWKSKKMCDWDRVMTWLGCRDLGLTAFGSVRERCSFCLMTCYWCSGCLSRRCYIRCPSSMDDHKSILDAYLSHTGDSVRYARQSLYV